MRRYLIIAAVAIVLLGLGVVAYFFFFPKPAGVAVTTPSGNTTLPSAGQTGVPTDTTGIGAGGTSGTPTGSAGVPVAVSSRLVKISAGPVVPGVVVIAKKSAVASSTLETSVNFIERGSGNVFAYSTSAKTLTRTSNKTIPGIQSAVWLPDGSLAYVRYFSGDDFSTINTYALPSNGVNGFFLSQNLADIAASATNLLTLASGVNGSTASLTRTDGTKATTVFSTPLSSLRASFAGKQYLAVTKATATLAGSAFLVDAAGRFSRVAGPRSGLVAHASPSGKWVLASYTRGARMQMELVNTATGEAVELPVATIADKCVWAADDSVVYCGIPVDPPANASYPDDWYQGAVPFSDRIWKIQIAGRYAQLVLDFSKETEGVLDATSLAIDSAGTVLVFVNTNDGSLWAYSL